MCVCACASGGAILSFVHLHIVQTQSEEEDRKEKDRERSRKDTKGRVDIKSGGERAIQGGGEKREAKRESRKAQDDCYSSINDGT